MAAPQEDRNLLFGILALQMDFIGREALVSAMNAWVLEKSRPLGEVLVRQNALSQANHDLLAPLVDAHIRRHGNDPQQSLAAISSLTDAVADLRTIADADVQASLGRVSAARAGNDPWETISHSVGAATSAGTRFRVLRPHAEGGLGIVSVARDEELSREVALKEIKLIRAHDPQSRARFLLEAEVTGGLEHPNIIPVYGLGQYADGRPFYVMRFIRGDNLKDAVNRYHSKLPSPDHAAHGARRGAGGEGDSHVPASLAERSVEFHKLLRRFVDVCNAIEYAHHRGVLHRDLKPGNIMLGKYGETLVVDWGLSKVMSRAEISEASEGPIVPSSGSGSAETQMGAAIGTPAFMSPEQAAGRLDHLGPASDIYSLGATLYYLLTNRSPFRKADAGAVLQQVQRASFPPPRKINSTVPAALEAICLKAMALSPSDRYASSRALADDIERWLADEPVVAYREPLPARTARWGRKHKTLVAGGFGLVAAAAIALAVSTVLIKREQLLTEKAKDLAKDRLTQVEMEKKNVEAERKKAEEEKQIAQAVQDFLENKLLGQADVRQQADFLIKAGRGAAEANPNMTVRELLDHAATELTPERIDTAFPNQARVQAAILRTVGNAYRGVGELMRGAKFLERTLALSRKELGPEHPDTLAFMNDLAGAYQEAGNLDLALPLLEETYKLTKAIVGDDHPNTFTSMNNLALAYQDAGRLDLALPLLEETLKLRKAKLGPKHPHTLDSISGLGDAYRAAGRPDLAMPLLEQALQLRKANLGSDHPDTLNTMNNLALAYYDAGKSDLALPLFEETLKLTKAKLGPEHPATLQGMHNVAAVYKDAGRLDLALPMLEETLKLRKAKLGPNHRDTLMTMDTLATAYRQVKQFDRSIQLGEEALRRSERKLGPKHPETLIIVANLGSHYKAAGRVAAALPLLERAAHQRRFQACKRYALHCSTATCGPASVRRPYRWRRS